MVSGDTPIDSSVHHAIERHAEQIDVAVQLLVLVLANQRSQLLVLVLHHRKGILQGAHLHLAGEGQGGAGCREQNCEVRDAKVAAKATAVLICTPVTHQLPLVHLEPA